MRRSDVRSLQSVTIHAALRQSKVGEDRRGDIDG
jgi:hypothetical protein